MYDSFEHTHVDGGAPEEVRLALAYLNVVGSDDTPASDDATEHDDTPEIDEDELIRRARIAIRWLHHQGRVDEARQRLTGLIARCCPDATRSCRLAATLHRLLGVTYRLDGRPMLAADELMKAKVLYEFAHDRHGVAMSLNALGSLYGSLYQWTIAEECFTAARQLGREIGMVSIQRKASRNLEFAYLRQGRLVEVSALWHESRALPPMDAVDDPYPLSGAITLARLMRTRGFPAFGRRVAERALEGAEQGGFRRTEAYVLHVVGQCVLDMGDVDRAIALFKRELQLGLDMAPVSDVVSEAYLGLARSYAARGDTTRTRRAIEEGLRISDEIQDDQTRVGLLSVRGMLAFNDGDVAAADRDLREARSIAARCDFQLDLALCLETEAFLRREAGEAPLADSLMADAAYAYRRIGAPRLARQLERGRRALSRGIPHRRRVVAADARAERWEAFGLVTRDKTFLDELERTALIAETPLPILICGESGVGKELVAGAIHELSGRQGVLVDINCPAIPETMLESELFGCRRGAFTGAEDRPGLVSSADGGTLFLDEIGDMPLGLQSKLLRFLETSRYRRVGGRTPHSVNTRLVSATNSNLEDRVRSGAFRDDLFHRIAGVVVTIPALRDRPTDIDVLTDHFVQTSGGNPAALSASVRSALRGYAWPGNVRELKHVIQQMVWSASGPVEIGLDLVPERIRTRVCSPPSDPLDHETLTSTLVDTRGSVAESARRLGLSRQQIYRRIEEMGLDLSELRGAGS